jgi:hypothetical protein
LTFTKRTQCKREEKVLPSNTQRNDKGKEQLQGERERGGWGEKRKGSKVGAQQRGSSREQSGLIIIKL